MTLDVVTEASGNVRIVHVTGKLDTNAAEAFDARLRELVDGGNALLVLDLAHVTYVSSMGLRSLIMIAKIVKGKGGTLALAAPTPTVREVLDIAGFTSIFSIAATTEEALALMQPGR
jgi:anti-anti-sigma factor